MPEAVATGGVDKEGSFEAVGGEVPAVDEGASAVALVAGVHRGWGCDCPRNVGGCVG